MSLLCSPITHYLSARVPVGKVLLCGKKLLCYALPVMLLSGCCLSTGGTAGTAGEWRLISYWQPEYITPILADELLVVDRAPGDVAAEGEEPFVEVPDRSPKALRSAFFRQVKVQQPQLQRQMRRHLLTKGWVMRPDTDDITNWRLQYTFTVFSPTFRGFSLSGFFKNLWNPLPGAALVGAFPATGGEYQVQAVLYDCLNRQVKQIVVEARGQSAMESMARQLAEQIKPVRPPRQCIPSDKDFFNR